MWSWLFRFQLATGVFRANLLRLWRAGRFLGALSAGSLSGLVLWRSIICKMDGARQAKPAFGSALVWISLCSLCVLCVSVVLASCIPITPETQITQRLYREE